jgi:hypothetical protein
MKFSANSSSITEYDSSSYANTVSLMKYFKAAILKIKSLFDTVAALYAISRISLKLNLLRLLIL